MNLQNESNYVHHDHLGNAKMEPNAQRECHDDDPISFSKMEPNKCNEDDPTSFSKMIGGSGSPSDEDVVCGRGGRANKHPGNIGYRRLVTQNKSEYQKCQSNEHKQFLAVSIVVAIQKKGGRFLKRSKDKIKWEEVPRKDAVAKTAQALREQEGAARHAPKSLESIERLAQEKEQQRMETLEREVKQKKHEVACLQKLAEKQRLEFMGTDLAKRINLPTSSTTTPSASQRSPSNLFSSLSQSCVGTQPPSLTHPTAMFAPLPRDVWTGISLQPSVNNNAGVVDPSVALALSEGRMLPNQMGGGAQQNVHSSIVFHNQQAWAPEEVNNTSFRNNDDGMGSLNQLLYRRGGSFSESNRDHQQ